MDSSPDIELPKTVTSAMQPAPIRRLEQSVVNRIAAGEVIQRPASALKELLENSLDAGATSVSVTVKDGGLKLIQISDNGHGIRFEDLPLLCERHATSKLREFEDLQSISTLGFRGEALASMTFVAHLAVTTMTEGKTHGYKVSYKDGKMEGQPKPCAALKGTQFTIENLFYNVMARKKAFKAPGEEYGRILDVISRYAVHKIGVSFSCKKHGENRADVHATSCTSRVESVRTVYGPGVARELISVDVSDDCATRSIFQMTGLISSANYSAKKTIMVLFINDRLVECNFLRKAIEVVYSTILPKASKPFLYLSITIPPEHVDVNVHPTKREVSFLNQESMVDTIQRAIEGKLLESNTSKTFYTQTLLPGAAAVAAKGVDQKASDPTASRPAGKVPVHKLVRTDALNPAGRLHAYMQSEKLPKDMNELAATRKLVRQRRNPKESAELTSVQELLAEISRNTHSELSEVIKNCIYIGMADAKLALVQFKTCLYLLNIVNLSKELMYQQVLRRFAHFDAVQLSTPAPLLELLKMALSEEERAGAWQEIDGPQEEIAKLNEELLKSKAEMLLEYFSVDIDQEGNLRALPIILDQYSPDMDLLPGFVLCIGNNVEWESEKECFETFSAALADFYAMHPPSLPHPSEEGLEFYRMRKSQPRGGNEMVVDGSPSEESEIDEELVAEAEEVWAKREWTIQHVLFPAMKLFLSPQCQMSKDGTVIRKTSIKYLRDAEAVNATNFAKGAERRRQKSSPSSKPISNDPLKSNEHNKRQYEDLGGISVSIGRSILRVLRSTATMQLEEQLPLEAQP